MNARDRARAALAGGSAVAFAPLAWARLPAFVNAAGAGEFWLDPGLTQRLLTDAGDVCTADALTVPVLPGLRSGTPPAPVRESAEVAALAEVTAAVRVIGRLAGTGAAGLVAEMPTLAQLARLLPGAAAEDAEDALCDLARACLEAGADALTVRGDDQPGVAGTAGAVQGVAGYYGAPVLAVAGERGWAPGGGPPVGLLGPAGHWPELAHGIVLTSGDITGWWTPAEARALLAQRGEAG